MKITVACVGRAGRAKHDAAQSLLEDYRARLPWPVTVKEVEDRKQGGSTAERKSREGELLLAALPKGAVIVALDEHGKSLTSRKFAETLAGWRRRRTGDRLPDRRRRRPRPGAAGQGPPPPVAVR